MSSGLRGQRRPRSDSAFAQADLGFVVFLDIIGYYRVYRYTAKSLMKLCTYTGCTTRICLKDTFEFNAISVTDTDRKTEAICIRRETCQCHLSKLLHLQRKNVLFDMCAQQMLRSACASNLSLCIMYFRCQRMQYFYRP